MEPSTLALPVLINGVRALATAYDGYEKGKFLKSDQAVRGEIRRRITTSYSIASATAIYGVKI